MNSFEILRYSLNFLAFSWVRVCFSPLVGTVTVAIISNDLSTPALYTQNRQGGSLKS